MKILLICLLVALFSCVSAFANDKKKDKNVIIESIAISPEEEPVEEPETDVDEDIDNNSNNGNTGNNGNNGNNSNGNNENNENKYSYNASEIIVSVFNEESGKSEQFSLSQNYPNPFNAVTTISFSLAHSNHVTLKVFNLLGVEVATLADNIFPAGNKKLNGMRGIKEVVFSSIVWKPTHMYNLGNSFYLSKKERKL